MSEFLFTMFLISITAIVIAGAVAFHFRKKQDMREAIVDEAERLMNQFLDNPTEEHFTVCYKHLAINEIKTSEINNLELVSQFISYIQNNPPPSHRAQSHKNQPPQNL